jgi:hypothetical protein
MSVTYLLRNSAGGQNKGGTLHSQRRQELAFWRNKKLSNRQDDPFLRVYYLNSANMDIETHYAYSPDGSGKPIQVIKQ